MSKSKDVSLRSALTQIVKQSYKEQAEDENITWTPDYDRFVEDEVESLFGPINQQIDIYFSHLASSLPDFSDEDEDQ